MKPTAIVIHCSDSSYGTVDIIDHWHKMRGWSGIGYHYVIGNGYTTKSTGKPDVDYTPGLGLWAPPGVRTQHPQHIDGLRKGRQGLFHGRFFPVPGAVHQKDVFAQILFGRP